MADKIIIYPSSPAAKRQGFLCAFFGLFVFYFPIAGQFCGKLAKSVRLFPKYLNKNHAMVYAEICK